jgi:hypothetical protein
MKMNSTGDPALDERNVGDLSGLVSVVARVRDGR